MSNVPIVQPAEVRLSLLAARVENNTAILDLDRNVLAKIVRQLRDIPKEDVIRIGIGYILAEYIKIRSKLSDAPLQVEEVLDLCAQATAKMEKIIDELPKPLKVQLN